jgi:hypothetical protein
VVNTRFKFEWGFCGTFESHSSSASLEVDPDGHWVFEDPRGQTLAGTFAAPDRVEGTLVSVERQTPSCPRTEATFTAAPVPPTRKAWRRREPASKRSPTASACGSHRG